MLQLKQIDTQLTFQLSRIRGEVDNLQFSAICEFGLAKKSLKNIPWGKIQYPGIYFIEIKNCNKHTSFDSWVNEFKSDWTHEKYKGKFVPNPKIGRIRKHSQLSDWLPLYIGKSKNIATRIREHIFLEMDQRTYALKLKDRDHLKNDIFRISAIRVDVNNYDWIMPVLEKAFRDKLNPIIGRQ